MSKIAVAALTRQRLPWATYLLVLGQALNLTAAVLSVTMAALVGAKLAPSLAWGTVPYGAQFAAVMIFTYPAAMFMRRYGRRWGFRIGAFALILAGAVGYRAVSSGEFALLIVAHALLGAYIACANFYRFAAVDRLDGVLKARAISLVVSGGVLAAVIGPLLASTLRVVPGEAEFALCYAVLIVLGLSTLLIMMVWKEGAVASGNETATATSMSIPVERIRYLPIVAAILAAAGGYFIMNLFMVQASLVMKNLCSFDASSRAIQAHVLAMFAPSFITGNLITRLGLRPVLMAGFVLLACSTLIGVMQTSYESIFVGLVLLGLGWNFTYVGGGALLAQSVPQAARHRWQGINDSLIAACATLGAFSPAPLLSILGWSGSNLIGLPLCILVGVVCWRALGVPKAMVNIGESHATAK